MIDTTITSAVMGSSHMTKLLKAGGWGLQLFYSIVTLAAFIALIVNITKLGSSGGNPQARSNALRNILISGVCLAVLGSLGVVYAVYVSLAMG